MVKDSKLHNVSSLSRISGEMQAGSATCRSGCCFNNNILVNQLLIPYY